MAPLSITRQEWPAQPILFIRRRIARSELQGMLAECLGKLFTHGHKAGLAIAGFPLARYVSTGPGLCPVIFRYRKSVLVAASMSRPLATSRLSHRGPLKREDCSAGDVD